MSLPPAPPLTAHDEVPAPVQRASLFDTIFWWKWHRKERLIIAGVLLAISAVLGVASCTPGQQIALTRTQDATVHISASSSSVCWSGAVGGATHDGCGDTDIPVHDQLGMFSSSVQKKDATGAEVTISIVVKGETVASNSTSADYGVALVIAPLR